MSSAFKALVRLLMIAPLRTWLPMQDLAAALARVRLRTSASPSAEFGRSPRDEGSVEPSTSAPLYGPVIAE